MAASRSSPPQWLLLVLLPSVFIVDAGVTLIERMVRGRRVTDDRSIDATTMVLNGLINTRILATCREVGIDAVGLSGVDAGPPVAELLACTLHQGGGTTQWRHIASGLLTL